LSKKAFFHHHVCSQSNLLTSHSFFANVIDSLISAIYEKHKDVDGFLYITYSGENTFGFLEEIEI
jgi:hypothetical protein